MSLQLPTTSLNQDERQWHEWTENIKSSQRGLSIMSIISFDPSLGTEITSLELMKDRHLFIGWLVCCLVSWKTGICLLVGWLVYCQVSSKTGTYLLVGWFVALCHQRQALVCWLVGLLPSVMKDRHSFVGWLVCCLVSSKIGICLLVGWFVA